MYTGHSTVKIFDYEEKAKEKFKTINNEIYKNAWRAEFFSGTLQSTIAAAERVFEILDEKEEVPDLQVDIKTDKTKGDVSIKNVKFGYSKDKPIISRFLL
ncbi:MAG: ABC-type multidrug transport system fused ATPase/permease subunit [Clostridium sp.]|jgi:ABC-type multidrug transport system fused ATPase/permease subunit